MIIMYPIQARFFVFEKRLNSLRVYIYVGRVSNPQYIEEK